jgi:DNA polymerase-3 subunit alpha
VIIAPDDVSDFVPLAGYGKSISTQYDGNVLESQGLLKMDFLGLSTLTMINDAVSHIKKNRGIDVNIDEIPLDDPEVFKILSNAWTAGLFQVDSELFQGILRRMQPDRFEDIIALVALGRPGPLGMGMDKVYCESRHDPEKISYPHELLQELLQETYGVILYQEQVMNTAVILAGYRMAEADDLRKVMGKKIAAKLPAHREKFVKGARELHQIDEKISDGIFDLMATFAEYGFNKSHSACYGLVCYQTCWLKAHYPQEFMAASLSDKIDSQEAVAYRIADCNRMKIPIRPPSVNGSEFYFSVEGDAVRFGMGAVKEVGSRAIECIIQARDEGGEFKSLRDFCYRVDLFAVNKKVIENLIKVGAFDELPGNRKQKLAIYEGCYQEGQEYQKNRRAGQKSLFEIKGTPQIQADKFNEELECSPVEQLAWEKELTGIYFSGHPLEPYRFYLEKATSHRVGEVEELANKTKILAAGMVSNFRRKISKKGEDYIQFVLTDFESSVDCVVFPRQFKRVTFKVLNDQIVILSGSKSVQMFNNRTQLIVDDMELIPALHESARWKMALSLFLTPSDANSESLGQLKELIEKHCGKKDFRLRYRSGGYDVSLKLPGNTGVSGDRDCIHDIGRVFGFEKMFLNVTPPVFTR